MYITTGIITDAPEFKATYVPPKDEYPQRMHLSLGHTLAVILTLPELRQLADVIADALQPVYDDALNAEA
jgi:hypothetical protein